MAEQKFGGNWTDIKLECLKQYLIPYRQIFRKSQKASFFKTWYVDAFAGTGSRLAPARSPDLSLSLDVYQDAESSEYREGSARIAISLPDPFDNYLFIEKEKGRLAELQQTINTDFPALVSRCEFRVGEANKELKDWCSKRDWKKERAVVFLDPYGMQVEWSTVETLAATKGIDLWYLFPLGIGLSRLLTRDGKISEPWKKRLHTLLGTTEWEARFYQPKQHKQQDLFSADDPEAVERDASVEKLEAFIHERLATCFAGVAKGKLLENSKRNPLYLLCFAAGNEKGAPIAINIAQHILGRMKTD